MARPSRDTTATETRAMRRMLPPWFDPERRKTRRFTQSVSRCSVSRGEAGGKALAGKAVAGREDHSGYVEVEAEVEERRDHLAPRVDGSARAVGQAGHALEEDVLGHHLRGRLSRGVQGVLDHEEILGRVRA